MRTFVVGFILVLIVAYAAHLWAASSHENGNIPENKIYVIEAAFTDNLEETVAKRDNLGRAIAHLAQQVNEPVWFHDYKDPTMAGAPVIILECSKGFIEQIKNLPEYVKSYDLWPSAKTERSASIKQSFSAGPAP